MPAVLPLAGATSRVALVVRNFTRRCHRDGLARPWRRSSRSRWAVWRRSRWPLSPVWGPRSRRGNARTRPA